MSAPPLPSRKAKRVAIDSLKPLPIRRANESFDRGMEAHFGTGSGQNARNKGILVFIPPEKNEEEEDEVAKKRRKEEEKKEEESKEEAEEEKKKEEAENDELEEIQYLGNNVDSFFANVPFDEKSDNEEETDDPKMESVPHAVYSGDFLLMIDEKSKERHKKWGF